LGIIKIYGIRPFISSLLFSPRMGKTRDYKDKSSTRCANASISKKPEGKYPIKWIEM
jgi:hypothetical protein